MLKSKCSREHLSVIEGLSLNSKLYQQVLDTSCKGFNAANFLRHLSTQIHGKILVIWDGAPIHRSKEVKEFLSNENQGRIELLKLPAYAPDTNPVEGVWCYLKKVLLKNQCFADITSLKNAIKKAFRRLRTKRHVLDGCISQTEV